VEDEQGEAGESEASKALLSPKSETAESEGSNAITSPTDNTDVADRAAAMLENLGSGGGLNKDGSLSVRRRRESADSERERRRRRRQQASSRTTDDGALMSPSTIPEEGDGDGEGEGEDGKRNSIISGDGTDSQGVSTPVTIVHPPSPEQKRGGDRELPTPPPE
jgi:cytokinesis protein